MADITADETNLDTSKGGRLALFADFWSYFSENRGAVMGLWFFVFVILMALSADIIAPHDPIQQYRDALLNPPAWEEGGDARFLLGTDAVGRDMLSRIIYGSRFSLFIGCVVVSLSLISGILLGLLAGTRQRSLILRRS